jgi:hypothetical protein
MPQSKNLQAFEQVLAPLAECLTQESARRLLQLKASPEAQARIDELAEKCNEGTLSADEHAEYEALVWAGSFVAVVQAKARRLLQGRADS